MTVSDLVAVLRKLPQDYTVDLTDRDGDVVKMEESHIVNMDVFSINKIQIG
jgi:hypothetical protein